MNAVGESPFFLPPHADDSGGVDYLGLRAINLQMMDQFLPGLNNVASRVRPFSLLTWTIWVYEDRHRQQRTRMDAQQYAVFREKVEALFILSHRLTGISVTGIAGADQRIETRKNTTLRFDAMNRQSRNTLIEAVNYGPGLKGDGGYHFAYPHPEVPKVFLVTKAGEQLAKSFDAHLRKKLTKDEYNFLSAFDRFTMRTEDVKSFASAWHLEKLPFEEQQAFLSRFYPIDDARPREQQRVATIDMILTILERSTEPLNVHEIRRSMTMDSLPKLSAATGDARWHWRALQLRQAQRLAMETLFGYLERCIWQKGMHTASQYATQMTHAIKSARPDWNDVSALADRLAHFAAIGPTSNELFSRGRKHAECDVVGISVDLEREAEASVMGDEAVAKAVDLLILVAVHTEYFVQDSALTPHVTHRSLQRLPLQWWARTLRERANESLQTFLLRLVETWLVSQHLGVAASRSSEDSGRMRLSIDDAGIDSMLISENKCWSPRLTADRLPTALSLMRECNMIQSDLADGERRYFLTEK